MLGWLLTSQKRNWRGTPTINCHQIVWNNLALNKCYNETLQSLQSPTLNISVKAQYKRSKLLGNKCPSAKF